MERLVGSDGYEISDLSTADGGTSSGIGAHPNCFTGAAVPSALSDRLVRQIRREGFEPGDPPTLLGRGHFATTFLVERQRGSSFAMKVSQPCIGAPQLNRVMKELTALAKLPSHPNIVSLEDFFLVQDGGDESEEDDGGVDGADMDMSAVNGSNGAGYDPYLMGERPPDQARRRRGRSSLNGPAFRLCIVMKYYALGSLENFLLQRDRDEPPPASSELWRNVLDLLTGLAVIHQNGFVHRDIKPDNVLRGADGRLLLCDLGLSRAMPNGTYVGQTAFKAYLAPDAFAHQLADSGSWSPHTRKGGSTANNDKGKSKTSRPTLSFSASTDMFSLGCVLVDLATAKLLIERPADRLPSASIDAARDLVHEVASRLPNMPTFAALTDALLQHESAARPTAKQALQQVPGGLPRLIELMSIPSLSAATPSVSTSSGGLSDGSGSDWRSVSTSSMTSLASSTSLTLRDSDAHQRETPVLPPSKIHAIPPGQLTELENLVDSSNWSMPICKKVLYSGSVAVLRLGEPMRMYNTVVKLLSTPGHPLIAATYGYTLADDLTFGLVTEALDGPASLGEWLRSTVSKTPFRPDALAKVQRSIVRQAAAALSHLHGFNVAHLGISASAFRVVAVSHTETTVQPTVPADARLKLARLCLQAPLENNFNDCYPAAWASPEFLRQRGLSTLSVSGRTLRRHSILAGRDFETESSDSCASDLYMFGTLIYEVLTFGQQPYGSLVRSLPQAEAVRRIIRDCLASRTPEHAGQPVLSPAQELPEIMRRCWNFDSSCRPTANNIFLQIIL